MIIILIIPVILIIWGGLAYNLLVKQGPSIKNAWSQIDIQLKKDMALSPI